MSDLEQRMRELDDLRPPDLWLSIEVRASRPRTLVQRILDALRLVPPMQVVAVAVALAAIIWGGVVVNNFRLHEIETTKQPGGSGNEKGGIDETGGGVQIPEGGPVGFGGLPGASTGMQGSSKDSRPGGSLPEDTNETAGPPVFYTDQADDAYGPSAHPNAALSQSAFDILRVDWAPVSYVNEQSPGGYSTSITVAGVARDDGAYVSYGLFYPGETCQLYHFLTPGITAFANAFCGSVDDGTRRFVGRVEGGPVTSTPTEAGGTRLSATFDNRAIPPLLQSVGRTLNNLSAFTCAGGENPGAVYCSYDVLDWARSTLTYRI